MTWQEFKAAVERQGVQDEDTIFSIEIGNYPKVQILRVDLFHLPSGERDVCIASQRESCSALRHPVANACSPMLGDIYTHSHMQGAFRGRLAK